MKKYYGTFYIKRNSIEFNLLEDIKTQYAPIYNKFLECNPSDKSLISTWLDALTTYINKKVLKKQKKSEIYYSIVLKDSFATENGCSFDASTHEFDLKNNIVDEEVKNEYDEKQYIVSDKNSYIISNKTYLFEVVDKKENAKQYAEFPLSKKGEKLLSHQMIITIPTKSEIVNLINLLTKKGYQVKQVLLKSQCLDLTTPDNKFKMLVNFSWNKLNLLGTINKNVFFYDKHCFNQKKFMEFLSNRVDITKPEFEMKLQAISNNHELYETVSDSTEEKQIYIILKKAIDQFANKTARILNELNFDKVEIVIAGKNVEFVAKRFKEIIKGVDISIVDTTESKLSNVKNHFLGAAFIANNYVSKKENLLNTINDLPSYKRKQSWFQKFINFFKPSHSKSY